MIGAVALLLCCQLMGEIIAQGAHVPVPGPVLGMVLLFLLLLLRHGGDGEISPALGQAADALLGSLGLLFIPAGVGVVLYGPLLAQNWLPMACAIIIGTTLAVAFTGRLAQLLFRRWH